MRPLVMDFQNDPRVYNITDEYMFGPSILVAPVTAAGVTSRSVYLPSGLWYDFWTGQAIPGGQTISAAAPYDHIPLYVKAGSILPLGPANAQYAAQAVNPTEIRVYPGADGRFTSYSDSGDTYAYAQGAFQNIPPQLQQQRQHPDDRQRERQLPGHADHAEPARRVRPPAVRRRHRGDA